MQKLCVVIALISLLGIGFTFYSHMMSDEMQLERLGYSKEVITQLRNENSEMIDKIIRDKRSSEELLDYLFVKNFNYDCYDEYVDLKEKYPELEATEVVYVASFFEHVFVPTLLQNGYDETTIDMWFQSPNFSQYIKTGDITTLNSILSFAKETGNDLYTLLEYVSYEKRYPQIGINETIAQVDEYQNTIFPALKQKGYQAEEIEVLYTSCELTDLKALIDTDLNPSQTLELMTASSFSSANFEIYDEVLNSGHSITYALQYAKYPNVKSNFYEAIVSTPNPNQLLALVNKNYQLEATYVPTDFVPLDVTLSTFALTGTNYLRRDAADATEKLFEAAKEEGIELLLRSGYISYETQKKNYEQDLYEMGMEYAEKISMRPGHSEHQLGLAIDVTSDSVNQSLSVDFAKTEEGKWVLEHANEFGFIIRYPENREAEVGYTYQPWHLRYVGVEVASEIYENDWVLEDYILTYGLLDQ